MFSKRLLYWCKDKKETTFLQNIVKWGGVVDFAPPAILLAKVHLWFLPLEFQL